MNRTWIPVMMAATFFAGDRLGGMLLENLLYRSPQRFPSLYEGRFDADVVCIGSSRGVYAVDTEMIRQRTGKSVVNISHNAMSPQIARAIFADYISHNVKPNILIVEASFVTAQTSAGTVLDYKPFWNRSGKLRALGETFSRKSVVACDFLHLYRYNSEMFLRAMSYWLRGRSDQGGFMSAQISAELVAETEQLEPFELEVEPAELQALQGLVQDARDSGVTVKLFCTPYLPIFADRITNLADVLAEVSNATGIEVIDYSRALSQTDQFADRVHMSRSGTLEITQQMIERGMFE